MRIEFQCKGITLTKEELKKLHKLIGEEICQMGGRNNE